MSAQKSRARRSAVWGVASAQRPLPRAGELLADKYVVARTLGHGGMSVVYEAHHVRTGRPFALKWLLPRFGADPVASARLAREAEVACAIGHPAVVDVYDIASHRGHPFLVMERLSGETLAERLSRGPMALLALLQLLLPVFEALDEAHALTVVHRDLKPENLYLTRMRRSVPEQVKILDFGVSKYGADADELRLTGSEALVGTPYCMAPEQMVDPTRVDCRADVYAMGGVLFEALSGRAPFTGTTLPELVYRITREPAPRLRDVVPGAPRGLDEVVAACLAKAPEARPRSMAELAGWLSEVAGQPLAHWMHARRDAERLLREDLDALADGTQEALEFPVGSVVAARAAGQAAAESA
ncbi:MAG: serine/threonine-protein kinase [Myxococcota bacterium]